MYDDSRFEIKSHKGTYTVEFTDRPWEIIKSIQDGKIHFLIDKRLYEEFYKSELNASLHADSVTFIEALEGNKSLERLPHYVQSLIDKEVKRGHKLIAIGGGIVQDICCFLSAALFRGLEWSFFPSTLLAQADSCIGSKSSINCGKIKNILGTFTPPSQVYICSEFLGTLSKYELQSGVGEILKAHAIAGEKCFQQVCVDYDRLFSNESLLQKYIRDSLYIKKKYIELDEFDRGLRNIFNYGHTFGHAIEASTSFKIPHGVAVSMGMDLANFFAAKKDISTETWFSKFNPTLAKNYQAFKGESINFQKFIAAISKDKKNESKGTAKVILPDREGKISPYQMALDDKFIKICRTFFEEFVSYV